jgi:hypothetical protein
MGVTPRRSRAKAIKSKDAEPVLAFIQLQCLKHVHPRERGHLEMIRQHADDRRSVPVDLECLGRKASPAEALPPQRARNQSRLWRADAPVFLAEIAPFERPVSKHGQVIRRYPRTTQRRRIQLGKIAIAHSRGHGDRRERRRLLSPRKIVPLENELRAVADRRRHPEPHQFALVEIGQWPEQNAVDKTEHRG